MPTSGYLRRACLGFAAALLLTIAASAEPAKAQPARKRAAAPVLVNCTPDVVPYDIVYVHAPRYGDTTNTSWPDTTRPMQPDPGADLRLLHPNCTEEVLFPLPKHQGIVDAPIGNGAVSDPNVSFDGRSVVFAYYHDESSINPQRDHSYAGADIYRIDLVTRAVTRLTHQEFTPNTGNGSDFANCGGNPQGANCPRIGMFHIGPAFVARPDPARPSIVFTSTRNNLLPPKPFGSAGHVLQLFLMDWDGKNVEQIGYLNVARAIHPFQLADGRLLFTSWENQGLRDDRQFNLWFIGPDGTQWASASGFGENAIGHHFATQMPNGDIAVVRYYNFNNNGFGGLARFPLDPSGPDFLEIEGAGTYMPFERPGQVDLTDWASSKWNMAEDFPAPCTPGGHMYGESGIICPNGNANRVGKVTHPAAAPGGGILLTYAKGPANHNGIYVGGGSALPFYDGGIYFLDAAAAATGTTDPAALTRILNDPAVSEQWPRPVAPYGSLFPGRAQPVVWPDYANAGDSGHGLAANSPFGLIGSSSMVWRDTAPRPGIYGGDPDPFNGSHEFLYAWVHQGPDAGIYANDDIWAVRLLALFPATDRRYPNDGPRFSSHASERMRILTEMPVRHEGVIDGNGYTDTSFLARIPADVPFTFQTLDRNGMVLNMAQTWHQVRPGEARSDCGGCHAHTKAPLAFETTVAGQDGYLAPDAGLQTLLLQLTELSGTPGTVTIPQPSVTVEYFQDVRPILTAKCAGCHGSDASDGNLNLHADAASVSCSGETWPGTYYRLAVDNNSNTNPGCSFGLGTPAGTPPYFIGPQQTRYIRGFQSRESLLAWKVLGARLDGRANDTRTGDLDYAADAGHANLLTWDEKAKLIRWIDLGAPIDMCSWPGHPCGNPTWGWFEDDLRPTLWASPTVAEARAGPVSAITVAAYDLESGLAAGTMSVTFDVAIGGQPPGTNFAAGISPGNGATVAAPLPASVDLAASGATMTVAIADVAGHVAKVVRTFSASNGPAVAGVAPTSGPAAGGTSLTITGGNFVGGAGVAVGGAVAGDVVVGGPGQITAVSPFLSPGTLNDVAVTNPGGYGAILERAFLADFTDVPDAHIFHDHVEAIFRRGVTAGCGIGLYCPSSSITRGQMAVFLVRASSSPGYAPPPAVGIFADVPSSSTFAPWIEELYARGVTAGCSATPLLYCPGSPVTRAQMAPFLLKAHLGASYTPPPASGTVFGDVPVGSFAADWIEDLASRAITGGCGGGNYCPSNPNTRGQMAAFMVKTFGL